MRMRENASFCDWDIRVANRLGSDGRIIPLNWLFARDGCRFAREGGEGNREGCWTISTAEFIARFREQSKAAELTLGGASGVGQGFSGLT